MKPLFAKQALTSQGWQENVRIEVKNGLIEGLEPGSSMQPGDQLVGIIIPGLANVHSHAFQRVMAGHTEFRGPDGKDNFWSWRERMYALASHIDANAMQAIARQAYSEMLAAGFTSVAEFHYLHNEPNDDGTSEVMFESIATAANDAGIRLTYVPILYERAGLREPEPTAAQRRFARTVDQLLHHYEKVSEVKANRFQMGLGVHSLRAVSVNSLRTIAAAARDAQIPMHIHVAEQKLEVDECIEVLGARPVEWLLEQCDVDSSWCLVHATHLVETEIAAIARSGAVVGLCPSTEANLGDGLFPLRAYLELGGKIGIGSDSHVSINPFEELRWLEYGQRLVTQSRNVAAISRPQTGRSLYDQALAGGALACGRQNDQLREGGLADLIVLDDDSPMLAGHTSESFVDALVFSGFSLPIDRVMVDGVWRVAEGEVLNAKPTRDAYAAAAKKLNLAASR